MKDLGHHINSDEATVIDSMRQTHAQYENPSVTLLQITDADNANNLPMGAIVYQENTGSDTNAYLLEDTELEDVARDPRAFLEACVMEWAGNVESDGGDGLDLIRWGVTEPAEVPADYTGECQIISIGCYYSHSPVRYVEETDETGRSSVVVFPTRAAAQEWIDEQSEEVYRLDHNEAGRPTYYIVEA